MEGFGSVKKFHSLTKDSSERESREKRDEMEGEDLRVGFDKGTVCPGKEESCIKKKLYESFPGESRLAVISCRLETFPSQMREWMTIHIRFAPRNWNVG